MQLWLCCLCLIHSALAVSFWKLRAGDRIPASAAAVRPAFLETATSGAARAGVVPIYRITLPMPPQDQSQPHSNAQILESPTMQVNPSMPILYYSTVVSTRDVQTPGGAFARGQIEASVQKKQSSEWGAVKKLVEAEAKIAALVGEIQVLESQFTTNPAAALANIQAKKRIVALSGQIPAVAQQIQGAAGEVSQSASGTQDEFQSFAQSTAE